MLPPCGVMMELPTYPRSFFLLSNLKSGGYLWTLMRWSFLCSLVLNFCPQASTKHWCWKGDKIVGVLFVCFFGFRCKLGCWFMTCFQCSLRGAVHETQHPGGSPYLASLQVEWRDCHATPECGCLEAGRWGRSGDRSSRRGGAGSCSDAHTPLTCWELHSSQ